MQQWREIKNRHTDALVFFRVGDFYEMFYEDAEEGARLLDLTLTSRNNGSSRAPLAGIPVHALDNYLQRLIRLGRRVAICEQVEDPAQAKGIVRREVMETVTPGTVLADTLLPSRTNNYLAAVCGRVGSDEPFGVAWADLSTGEFWVRATDARGVGDLLNSIDPSEIVLPRAWEEVELPDSRAVRTYRSDWAFEAAYAAEELARRFEVVSLDGLGFRGSDHSLIGAAGGIVAYLAETQRGACAALRPPRTIRPEGLMELDEMTRRNLELVEAASGDGSPTLLQVIDAACTPMGARLLRRWLLAPLTDRQAIGARQDCIEEFVCEPAVRREVRSALGTVRDQQRLAAKIVGGRANPRDLIAVHDSLGRIPLLREALRQSSASLLRAHLDGLDPIPELHELIATAIAPQAPMIVADGGVIRDGYDAELDELRRLRDGAVDWIARLQAAERERTGIGSLKVGFNKVFGYYLEVTRANSERVPADYQRKQTLANAERYVTPELQSWEEKVLGAEEKIGELEARLFQGVRESAARLVPRLQRLAEHVAAVDVFSALAETAVQRGYNRPVVTEGFEISIKAGRHPVVETMMRREDFIPNDVALSRESRVMVLTGPNMAGKSTVLRQVGLIALLAQMGSFVPAAEATIGIVDRIFTRVGASDNLVRGRSTFMVEMIETAAILNSATPRSLVLLDEIGRGTSTWDGLSVATAVTEHLHDLIGAKTIFATHYHELTKLGERLPAVVNYSVAVREDGDRIVFLRSLVPEAADRSYGVEVARMAGLPRQVIDRARNLLVELEELAERNSGPADRPLEARGQLNLFASPPPHPAIERLRGIDPDQLTPVQALVALADVVALARA